MNKIFSFKKIQNRFLIFTALGLVFFLFNINDAQALSASTISPYQSTVKLTSTQKNAPVSRCTGAGCTNYVNIGTTASDRTYTDSNLSCGTIYRYQVYADGVAQATTDACTPGKPSLNSVTAANQTSINLNWSAGNPATQSNFKIFRWVNNQPIEAATVDNVTSGSISNLTCGSSMAYKIGAYVVGASGTTYQSALSDPRDGGPDVCTPGAPTLNSITPTSQTSINLTWSAGSPSTQSNFTVIRWVNNQPAGEVATFTNVTSGSISGLTCGSSMAYKIGAYVVGASGTTYQSALSNAVNGGTDACTPATPTNISAVPTSQSSGRVTWQDNATNETGYEIYYYLDRLNIIVGQTTSNQTSGTASGLSCNTEYRLFVSAFVDTNGRRYYSSISDSSVITTDACTPATPTNISATATGPNSATVSWKDNATNETGYKIYNYDTLAEVGSAGAGATSGTASGLACNTSYFLYPKAYVESNGRTYYSAFPGLPSAITTAACYQPSLIIDPASAKISLGSSQQLTGKYDPDGSSGPEAVQNITNGVTWVSSDKKIVANSSSGLIYGIDQGNAVMTLNYAGLTATAAIEVVVPTVVVALSADPNSGIAPVNGVDLTASVSTNISGSNSNYTYYFYCNRSDSGTDIQGAEAVFTKVSETTKTAVDRCNYSLARSYTPKVIVARNDGGFIFKGEARTTVTVSSPAQPDLAAQNLTINGTLVAGQSLTFSGDIKNIGGATAGASVASFCVNQQSQTQTFVNCLTSKNVPSLNSNEKVSINSDAWIAQAGDYQIWLVADINTAVSESNEFNNATKIDFTVKTPTPVPTFVLVPPTSSIQVGETQQYVGKYDPDGPSGPRAEQTVPADQVYWKTDQGSSVAKIDKVGLATGQSSGTASIIGLYENIAAYAVLNVYELTVSLAADPNSGAGQVNGVDLTASVSTSIAQTDPRDESTTYDYYFYCNRSDSGVNVTTDYAIHDLTKTNLQDFEKLEIDLCNYSAVGTYTPKVIVVRQPNFSFPTIIYKEARTSVVVSKPTGPLLQVTLNSANGLSGQAPFENWLQANVVSDIEATTNFTFWWDCNNATTNVQAAKDACGDPDGEIGNNFGSKFDARPIGTTGQGSARYTYSSAGTYTGKVIVERGSAVVEERTFPIVVTAPPPPPANHAPSVTPLAPIAPDYCVSAFAWTLSWNFADADGDTQSAYQVIVKDASTGQVLHDSTKIEGTSGASKEYSLAGKGFMVFNKEYAWTVKVWESNAQNLSAQADGQNFTTIKHAPPSVSFTWSPDRPLINEVMTFSDTASVYGGSTKSAWEWHLEQDAIIVPPTNLTTPQVMFKFTTGGPKNISLILTDSDGLACMERGVFNVQQHSIPRFREVKPNK